MESDASFLIRGNALSFTIGHDNDIGNFLKCMKNLLPVVVPLPRNLHPLELDVGQENSRKKPLTLNITARPPCNMRKSLGIAAKPGASELAVSPIARHVFR
jgi:hypothetical protein